jgi:hypothetical protein
LVRGPWSCAGFYTIRGFYHGKRNGEAETFLRRI